MWIKDFARTHPDVIVRGAVPYSEIAERLKEQYGAVAIPLAEIPSMRMHRYNAINLPTNNVLRLTEEQLKFNAIKIPITDKSSLYTVKDFVPVVGLDGKEFIYLVYEDQLRYHYSNSNRLFLEVAISRGVPEADIENETENYLDYLFYIKCYLAHTYPNLEELVSSSTEE